MELSYQSILKALPSPLFVCSYDGNIVFMNVLSKQIFGELENTSILEIIPALKQSEVIKDWFNQENERDFDTVIKNSTEKISWKCQSSDQDNSKSYVLLFPRIMEAVSREKERPDYNLFKKNHKLAENETETLLRNLFHNAPIGITLIDSKSKRFADCNPMMSKILGYSKTELQQYTYFDITPKRFHQLDRIQTEALYISGQFGPYEKEYFHKEGHTVTVLLHGESFFKNNGDRMVWLYVQDISQQKEQDKKLKDSLNSVKILFNEAPEAYILTDIKGNLIDANSAAEKLFKLNKNLYIGSNLLHLQQLPLSEVPKVASVLAQHAMGKQSTPYELIIKRKRDTTIILEMRTFSVAMENKTLLLNIAHEITERKNHENQIIQEKNKAQQYLDIAGSVIVGITTDHNISVINQAGCRLLNYEKPEIIGKNLYSFLGKTDETDQIKSYLNKCFETQYVPESAIESRLVLPDGESRYFLWKNNLICREDGKIDGLLSSGIDITELKRIQQLLAEKETRSTHLNQLSQLALQNSESREHWIKLAEILRSLFNSDECFITAWDEKQQMAVPLTAHGEIYDYYTSLESTPSERSLTRSVLEEERPLVVHNNQESPYISKAITSLFKTQSMLGIPMIVGKEKLGAILIGYLKHHEFSPDELEWGVFAANHLALAFHKTKLIDELGQSNAAKDHLFSVLSHDLKSPFAGVNNLTQLLLESHPPENLDEQKVMLESLLETTNRLNSLIDQLLNWNRLERGLILPEPEMLQLKTVVIKVFEQLQNEASLKEVELISEITDDIFVEADERMLQSVIRNICQNAIKFSLPKKKVIVKASIQSNKIELSITDQGIGMSKDTIQTLFKMNTAKSKSGTAGEPGTGMGLLIAHEFIRLHHGTIRVTSQAGKGSSFIITLKQKANQ